MDINISIKNTTENPIFCKVTFKFAVTVDFPTPPLPEAMAIIF